MQSVNDIRLGFLEFFRRNGHEVRPSGSLVPHNDPTLMFTNAGMNQFKNVFTGVEKLPFARAATAQKCVRAGGKHNDLDNVGYTARHHTFFEMLGNFSFGDYFKEEAIRLAWDLLTKDYGIDPKKLTVTVYHDDDVAWNYWKKISGFADHKIIRISTYDNFWSMGDTGPCGPCSEIFYDHGEHIKGGPPGSPDADGDRFVEIWNLVFMQYEQLEGGKRIDLPKPSIDTGMGLERLAAVLQGVTDNYDIDLFKHLITAIKNIAGSSGEPAAYKVIADHLRSSCFLIADGVMPSNEGRGYVLRRIMRRAMRYAHQIGCKEPLMYKLVPALVKEMGGAYPELGRAEATITGNLRQEEERFKQTLERGLKLLEEETANIIKGGTNISIKGTSNPTIKGTTDTTLKGATRSIKGPILSGDVAFKLYDTYGFPLDLTQDILRARGISVDTESFEKLMEGQRDMARASHKGSGDTATGRIWFELKEKLGSTEFLGYDVDEVKDAKILAIIRNGGSVSRIERTNSVSPEIFYIILNKTPFYGESGGQVGDHGFFYPEGGGVIEIHDTEKPLEDFIVHKATFTLPTKDNTLKVGDNVKAEINATRRNAIRANHSATHLLHKALRDQLGEHVTQKGSLVDAERLRFDFSHPKAVSREEQAIIERKVNDVVARNTPVACKIMSPDDAIKAGAMALFGEKYGDKVRVLSMGIDNDKTYSTELCGGTHVRATGNIGLFKITSEGSVASGIRRIEAVTGEGVRNYFKEALAKQNEQLQKLQDERARLSAELSNVLPPVGGRLGGGHSVTPQQASPHPNPSMVKKRHPDVVFSTIEPDGEGISSALLKDVPRIYETQFDNMQTRIQTLQDENKKLSKELAEAKKQQALGASGDVKPEKIGSINFIGKSFDGLDPKELRPVAENYLKLYSCEAKPAQDLVQPGGSQDLVVAVGSNSEGKASIVVAVSKALAQKLSAVTLVQAAVAELGGKGGGGRPEMAQGGGPEADKLEAAIEKIKASINLL